MRAHGSSDRQRTNRPRRWFVDQNVFVEHIGDYAVGAWLERSKFYVDPFLCMVHQHIPGSIGRFVSGMSSKVGGTTVGRFNHPCCQPPPHIPSRARRRHHHCPSARAVSGYAGRVGNTGPHKPSSDRDLLQISSFDSALSTVPEAGNDVGCQQPCRDGKGLT